MEPNMFDLKKRWQEIFLHIPKIYDTYNWDAIATPNGHSV